MTGLLDGATACDSTVRVGERKESGQSRDASLQY
jgi:hypothetical protein